MPRTAVVRSEAVRAVSDRLSGLTDGDLAALLDSTERLLAEIDPDATYPAEFILWRLTGERGAEEVPAIEGRALRRDLAILVQRGSERAPTDAAVDPQGALDLHEAAASLGVSIRTLQRWRDEGLVLRRIRFPDGVVRLGVLHGGLKSFRDRQPQRLHRAAGFSRITPEEEAGYLERARALMAAGVSLNQAALELAADGRRAHETIRQLIRRHRGERGPIRGMGGRVRPRERALVLRGLDRGLPSSELAHRLGRSVPSVRRIGAEARANRLRALRPDWIDLPIFAQADAEVVLLRARQVVSRPAPRVPSPSVADYVSGIRALGATSDALTIPAMHLQLRTASRQIDALPRTPPVGRLDEIETGLRRADDLRRRAGESVLAASIARVEQHLSHPITEFGASALEAWLAFCLEVVGDTLERFDPSARGELEPRLDRRVALETDKRIALLQRGGALTPAGPPHELRHPLDPGAEFERLGVLGLAPHLRVRLDRLPSEHRTLIEARFGLGVEQACTLEALAASSGLSIRALGRLLAEGVRRLHGPE